MKTKIIISVTVGLIVIVFMLAASLPILEYLTGWHLISTPRSTTTPECLADNCWTQGVETHSPIETLVLPDAP